MKDRKKHVGSLIFLLILIALTFYFLFRNQDLFNLLKIIKEANPFYICIGLLAMLLFLVSEAFGIWLIMNSFPFHFSLLKCLKYAFIGFFYCSITPTASGGPPMQIYYMKKDGAEISISSIAILVITVSYQIGILLIGLFMFVIRRTLVINTIGSLKIFLIYGVLINSFLIALLVSISFQKKLLLRILNGVVRSLGKMKVIKNANTAIQKVDSQLEEYQKGLEYIKTHAHVLIYVLLSILVQILSRLSVTFFVYKSFGLSGYHYLDILAMQSMLALAVDSLPLPGAVGAAESSFLIIYRAIFGNMLFPGMLLTRGINFYAFLLISGIIVFSIQLSRRKRG